MVAGSQLSLLFFILICCWITPIYSNLEHCPGNQPCDSNFNYVGRGAKTLFEIRNGCGCDRDVSVFDNKIYSTVEVLRRNLILSVCKVKEENSDRIYVLKVYKESSLLEFYNEIAIHGKLNGSSHFPMLYSLAILMEFVEKDENPPIITLRSRWANILNALQNLHKHDILHLDLHKNNIIHSKNNSVKLIDFSNACTIDDANKNEILFNKKNIPQYTAPEVHRKVRLHSFKIQSANVFRIMYFSNNFQHPQFQNDLTSLINLWAEERKLNFLTRNETIGPAADIWNACCILFELMYGKTPHEYLLLNYKDERTVFFQMDPLYFFRRMADIGPYQFIFPPYRDPLLRETVELCLVQDPSKRPTSDDLLAIFYKN